MIESRNFPDSPSKLIVVKGAQECLRPKFLNIPAGSGVQCVRHYYEFTSSFG